MLDGIGASAHRILHTGRAVGVHRDPASAGVRRVDNRLDLVERERLRRVHAVEAAAGRVTLIQSDPALMRASTSDGRASLAGPPPRPAEMPRPATNIRGPASAPEATRSRIRMSAPPCAPRSRIV